MFLKLRLSPRLSQRKPRELDPHDAGLHVVDPLKPPGWLMASACVSRLHERHRPVSPMTSTRTRGVHLHDLGLALFVKIHLCSIDVQVSDHIRNFKASFHRPPVLALDHASSQVWRRRSDGVVDGIHAGLRDEDVRIRATC